MKNVICFFALTLTLGAAGCAAPDCHTVQPDTPGWKAVDAIPGYGIQGDAVQFLSTTSLTLWENPGTDVKLDSVHEAKSEPAVFRFNVENPSGRYRRLKVTFEKSLAGMKADAFAFDRESGARVRLMDEHRVFEDSVSVAWPDISVSVVEIALHVHLSPRPILKEFAVGASGTIAQAGGIDEAFRRDGVLFFYSPDGGSMQLCRKPKFSEGIPLSMVRGRTVREVRVTR